MNKRQKKKKWSNWSYIRFKSDVAIYACCDNCLFYYPSYNSESPFKHTPKKPEYKYCPDCGKKMKCKSMKVHRLDYDWWEET